MAAGTIRRQPIEHVDAASVRALHLYSTATSGDSSRQIPNDTNEVAGADKRQRGLGAGGQVGAAVERRGREIRRR